MQWRRAESMRVLLLLELPLLLFEVSLCCCVAAVLLLLL